MKNETARREIESLDYYLQNHTNDYSEESHTAMMMAIDALSRSEIPIACGDAISRKYIIDLIDTKGKSLDDDLLIVEQWIEDAPSVTPQPCEDCISRQAVLAGIANISKAKANSDAQRILMGRVKFYTEQLPSVTPQQKTGRWIAYEVRLPDRTILNYRCSVCGRKLIGYNTETLSEAPFCHCGAKMQEVEE